MGAQRQSCCNISGGEEGPRAKTLGGPWKERWMGILSSDCPRDSGQITSLSEPLSFPTWKTGRACSFRDLASSEKSLIHFWGFCLILGKLEICQGTNIYRTLGILSGEVGETNGFRASLCPPDALQGCSDIHKPTHRSTQTVVSIDRGSEKGRSRWPWMVQEDFLEEGEFEPCLVRWAEFTRLEEGSRVSHTRSGQESGLTHTPVWDGMLLVPQRHCSRVLCVTITARVQPTWPHGSPWKICWDRCLPGLQAWGRGAVHLPLGL